MSQIRKAHSFEIIENRLKAYESSGKHDAMELIGLHDELSRVERKWRAKAAGEWGVRSGPRARPLANAQQMDARVERLKNLVDAALRSSDLPNDQERAFLERIAAELKSRMPLHRDE